jgi:hypothetical protein
MDGAVRSAVKYVYHHFGERDGDDMNSMKGTTENATPAPSKSELCELRMVSWRHSVRLPLVTLVMLLVHGQSALALNAEEVFSKSSPSVVLVVAGPPDGERMFGSGVVVAKEAVITNCHVAQAKEPIFVHYGKGTYAATIQYADSDRDMCQLRVPTLEAVAISLGSVKNVRTGQRVFAIGSPQGLALTISEGLVSSLRPIGTSKVIQTSAAISKGSSGGGLFDAEGRLIGITSFNIREGQNLNFAIPSDWIAELPKRSTLGKPSTPTTTAVDYLERRSELLKANKYKEWLAVCKKWTARDPGNSDAWLYLAEAHLELKQDDAAKSALSKAISIHEGSDSYIFIGQVYIGSIRDRPRFCSKPMDFGKPWSENHLAGLPPR